LYSPVMWEYSASCAEYPPKLLFVGILFKVCSFRLFVVFLNIGQILLRL
jgi:hypothetical protein